MKAQKALVLAGFALLAALLLATTTTSLSTGITRQAGLAEEGCICHGPNQADDGAPNPAVQLLFRMEPNDMVFKPGQAYTLTVGAAASDVPEEEGANKGGFNLRVSAGTLAPAAGFEDFVQVAGKEATHTVDGDQHGRVFNLTWTAPTGDEAGSAAIFTLFVNTVNGDGSNNAEDHWNGGTFVVLNEAGGSVGGGAEEINPEHIGVNWLAHWVGIISFVAVVVTLLLYYFVLKYGESIHTTDHRDRKEK